MTPIRRIRKHNGRMLKRREWRQVARAAGEKVATKRIWRKLLNHVQEEATSTLLECVDGALLNGRSFLRIKYGDGKLLASAKSSFLGSDWSVDL